MGMWAAGTESTTSSRRCAICATRWAGGSFCATLSCRRRGGAGGRARPSARHHRAAAPPEVRGGREGASERRGDGLLIDGRSVVDVLRGGDEEDVHQLLRQRLGHDDPALGDLDDLDPDREVVRQRRPQRNVRRLEDKPVLVQQLERLLDDLCLLGTMSSTFNSQRSSRMPIRTQTKRLREASSVSSRPMLRRMPVACLPSSGCLPPASRSGRMRGVRIRESCPTTTSRWATMLLAIGSC